MCGLLDVTWRDIGSEPGGMARIACQAFVCVLRLQTDIITQLNTYIVKVSKSNVEVSSCHCSFNSNVLIPQH